MLIFLNNVPLDVPLEDLGGQKCAFKAKNSALLGQFPEISNGYTGPTRESITQAGRSE